MDGRQWRRLECCAPGGSTGTSLFARVTVHLSALIDILSRQTFSTWVQQCRWLAAQSFKVKLQYSIFTFAISTLILLRLLATVYSLKYSSNVYFSIDLLAALLAQDTLTWEMWISLTTIPFYLVYQQYRVCFCVTNDIWQQFYELSELNLCHLLSDNPFLRQFNYIVNSHKINTSYILMNYNLTKKFLLTLWNGQHPSSHHLVQFTRPLPYFSVLSKRIRTRLVLVIWLVDVVLTLGSLTVSALLALFMTYIFLLLYQHYHSLLISIFFTIDLSLNVFNILKAFGLSLFQCQIVFLFSCLSTWFYSDLNRLLHNSVECVHKHHSTALWLSAKVHFFTREHIRLTNYILAYNINIGSRMIFLFYLCNIGFNSYSVAYVIFYRVPLANQLVFYQIWLAQLLGVVLSFSTAIRVNRAIHSASRYLHPVQLFLDRSVINQKLHLEKFYCLMHSKRGVGITVGPMGPFSRRFLIEFFIMYIGFLMFFFSFIMKRAYIAALQSRVSPKSF